ncbi:MAG TPA: non-homologous end-joining DNA ligase [Candidatus Baltobacteraceae bacterium]|jgi:bifunctional non-homologous end joining protein LigD|nr:non-homologous end-joining DNA ligase [Candidatus Baltobacteraceae bacterium]
MSTAERVPVKVGGRTLSLSNLEKVLWPRDGYTKGDLIEFYRSVAPAILPHLKDRPLTLQRYPNGIDGESFFEKRLPKGVPDWVDRVTTTSAEGGRKITYVVCNDEPTLTYVANLASIVLHVWTSRVETLDEPDFVFFDLDPGEKCTLQNLATVTVAMRDALRAIGMDGLVKTSGGMGLHLFVPLVGGYSYESVKLFAELAARHVASKIGDAVSLERTLKKRDPKAVYLDFQQVGRGKTYVVAYSVRARDGAPVSIPLKWSEVEAYARKRGAIAPWDEFAKFNIRTAGKRLKAEGDLWGGKAWKKQRLEPAIAKAQKLWVQ